MAFTDSNSGVTFGIPDGNDNWGPAMNRSLRRLAYLPSNVVVLNISLDTPPTSPAIGDRYAVGSTPTGAWSGYQPGDVAVYGQNATNTLLGWQRFRPHVGLQAFDRNTSLAYRWNGTVWMTEHAPVQPTDLHFDSRDFTGDGSAASPYRTVAQPRVQPNWFTTNRNDASYIRNVPNTLRSIPSSFDTRPFWTTLPFSGTGTHGGFGRSYHRLGNRIDLNPTLALAHNLSQVTSRGESIWVYVEIRLSNYDRGNTATLGMSVDSSLLTSTTGSSDPSFVTGLSPSTQTLSVPRNGRTSAYFGTGGRTRFYTYLEIRGSSDSFQYSGSITAGYLNRH